MRRTEAARYARWSAGIALLLALATSGVYLKRKWSQHVDRKNAPAPAPVNVERQSNGLTFSKVDGDRKIFTVTASKSTDFKDKGATLLETVQITIFGKAGDRNDVIRTQSCQYSRNTGAIECSGAVRMDLQSAADAERAAPNSSVAQVVHVETSRVTFDRANGLARTSQPVTFSFPGGSGQARGVEYRSEEGSVRLLSDVQFTLKPPATASSQKKKSALQGASNDVHIRGTRLDFDRNTRKMRLQGPADAHTETIQLSSNEMLVELDSAFRAQAFRAQTGSGKRPSLLVHARDGSAELSADTLVAHFSPEGWVSKAEATGDVQGARRTALESEGFSAATASLDLWPKVTQPKQLDLTGNVVVKTHANQSSESRMLQTGVLQLQFSGGSPERPSRPQLAQTLAPGTLEWTDALPMNSAAPHTKLSANRLELRFGATGKPDRLLANEDVRTERTLPGRAAQTASGKKGLVQLSAGGGWSQMELQGAVNMKEDDRTASADRAVFVRDGQTVTLTGKAVVRDASTETAATRITFHQMSGDILAEGGVRSTDLSVRSSAVQLAPTPANITADSMRANSKTGRALYSGHGRLWQGDSVLEADAIELLRPTRTLNATDHVRAIFPQAPVNAQRRASPTRPNLWHITAGALTYYDGENRAHLERAVVAQSAEQEIRSNVLDLYFTHGASANSQAPTAGARQISRGVATGGVTVEEGTRKAVAERGEYTAADGKFVMSGGSPTIFDGSAGTTTGRQLTFFLADDTIIVDSQNGSRTLTKHRVDR